MISQLVTSGGSRRNSPSTRSSSAGSAYSGCCKAGRCRQESGLVIWIFRLACWLTRTSSRKPRRRASLSPQTEESCQKKERGMNGGTAFGGRLTPPSTDRPDCRRLPTSPTEIGENEYHEYRAG